MNFSWSLLECNEVDFDCFSCNYHLSETYPSHLCGPRGKLEFTKLPDKNQASCQIAPMGGLQEAREKQGNTELFMNKQLNNSLHVKGVVADIHHALAHVDGLGQESHIAWRSLPLSHSIDHKESSWVKIANKRNHL